MRSSYSEDDVVLLLKDITGIVKPQPTKERERLIQAGRHYCEMLPIEYVPTQQYLLAYEQALEHYSMPVACAVGRLADKIITEKGKDHVLVSLARAGIPAGILLKRYFQYKYQIEIPHYAISIIRGKGIDRNAMAYLLERYLPKQLLFVDGWVGKGAIYQELQKALLAYPGVLSEIAVLADPANITELCGTHEDILIPSACLNSTVSGLISRTFWRDDIIKEDDFHGAVYYEELADSDMSYAYIHAIERHFVPNFWEGDFGLQKCGSKEAKGLGAEEAADIAAAFGITDKNLVKPGIGETTRVLLRRVPWKILVDEKCRGDRELAHIVRLAQEKEVPLQYYPLRHYKCCGIIQPLSAAAP